MQIPIVPFQRCLLKSIFLDFVHDIFPSQVYRPVSLKQSFGCAYQILPWGKYECKLEAIQRQLSFVVVM